MINPRIRSIGTIEGEPLTSLTFEDAENFVTTVRVMVGPSTGPGEESFDITVCSSDHLKDECQRTGYRFVRRSLVLNYWNATLVETAIREAIQHLTGESWDDLAAKLSRIGSWEFEDYQKA